MNGAAVNRQQEQPLRPQNNDSSSLHNPGYLLQTNYHCQETNPQHQYSKEMNYKLLPDNFSVDGSSIHSQYIDSYSSEPRNRLSNSGDILDSRINPTRMLREPMELPVPEFEIDENSVGVFTYKKITSSSVQDSTDLDLDTRINLLIKSKALSGMHPIFSDLNESEDSSTDSEEFYSDSSKRKPLNELLLPEKRLHQESFDDPEKPLSRPPSPFLSRATYLFWFNKAIELKQQAKAQEQALLEKATKMLGQGNLSSSAKVSKTGCSKQDSNLLKSLLSEVGRELKESIKQDFIKILIDNTVLNSLDDWWAKERKLKEENLSKDSSMVSSTTNDSLQSKDGTETNEQAKFQAKTDKKICQGQRSTSPKVLIPSSENKNQNSKEKLNILENQVTSIIEFNKTLVKEPDKYVLEGLSSDHGSVICKENDYLGTNSLNTNCTVDSSSFRVKESNTNVVEGLTAEHGTVICKEKDNLGTKSSNENCTVDSLSFSVKESDTDVMEGLTADHGSVVCKEKDNLGTKSSNENCTVDSSSFRVKESDTDFVEELTTEHGSVVCKENDNLGTKTSNENCTVDSFSFRVNESNTDVVEGLTAEHGSVICNENDNLGTKNLNERCTFDSFSFRESNPLILGEIETKNSLNDQNDTLDIRNTNASNNEMLIDKRNDNLQQDEKAQLDVPVVTEESNNPQYSPVIEHLPDHGKSVVESLIENILVKMERAEPSENRVIETVKSFDTLANLEENRFISKDSSLEKKNKEESCLQNNTEIKQNDNQ